MTEPITSESDTGTDGNGEESDRKIEHKQNVFHKEYTCKDGTRVAVLRKTSELMLHVDRKFSLEVPSKAKKVEVRTLPTSCVLYNTCEAQEEERKTLIISQV